MLNRLEAGETIRRLEAAVQEARDFFGIDPLYLLEVHACLDISQAAEIEAGDPYRRSWIKVNLDYYQQHPDIIRRDMAHEVAHLMSNEILQLQRRMPQEWQDKNAAPGGMLSDAIETLTVRLERLFLRERPEAPNAEQS